MDAETRLSIENLRREVLRDRRRFDAKSLGLLFLWQPLTLPHRFQQLIWQDDQRLAVAGLEPGWFPPGEWLCSMYSPLDVGGEIAWWNVYFDGVSYREVFPKFAEHAREISALLEDLGWTGSLPICPEARFVEALFERSRNSNTLVWEENEQPGHPETKSHIARLKDVYNNTECFLGELLESFGPVESLLTLPPAPKMEAEFLIHDPGEHYVICGFGEELTLQKSEGVERLVAVVTSPDQRLPILDLYQIGAGRRVRGRSKSRDEEQIDQNGDGISERKLLVDVTDDSRFDDDTPDAVWERVRGLIEERDLARKTGDEEEAQKITKVLDTLYLSEKKLVKNARDSVRNTINTTIERIDENRFPNLRKHFQRSLDLSDDKKDYVFAPAGLDIVWNISKR